MQRDKTEQNSDFFQRLFFNWVAPLIHVGLKKPLDEEDIFELNDTESPIQNLQDFESGYKAKSGLKNALFKTLWHLHKKTYGRVAALSSINLICVLLNPLLIREIIKFLQAQNGSLNKGIFLAFVLLISVLTASFGIQHLFHVTLKIGMRVRAGLVLAVYRKALRLTPEARQNSSTGEIVNLISNDAAKIFNFAPQLHSILAMPVQICVAVCMLFWLLGTSMIAGLLAMFMLTFFSYAQAKKMVAAQKMFSEVSDNRISAMGEILLGIRVIKFYAWEKFFFKNISKFREKEIQLLYILAQKRATVSVLFLSTPVVVGIVTFSTHLFLGKSLNAPDVFSALAFFGVIRPVLSQFPITLSAFIDAGLSAKRLEKFLNHSEIKPRSESVLESGSVRLKNASLSISKESGSIHQLQVEIAPGECVAVVGPVAAGKSLLLLALLGELNLLEGNCDISGSIAYVSQQAWIVNATVRENITFGSEFDPQKYAQCLFVCALEADLAGWPAGDQTEIGEQGVNLSGGQKQRISLARAVYREADIYLLDDPLSALDSGVSNHIFKHCINGSLKSKTRIYVTHRLEYAAHSNRVLLLENGEITECGTLNQIHQNQGRLWDLLSNYKKSRTGTPGISKPEMRSLIENVSHPPLSTSGKLVADEERLIGAVKSNIYRVYMHAIAPGFLLTILIGSFLLREVFAAANDGWLIYSTANKKLPVVSFLGVYAALGLCATLSTYVRTFLTFKGGIHASKVLHEKIIRSVLRSPMKFFESTPTGRVLNRFSKDMEVIDQYIPSVILDCFGCIFSIFSALFVVCAATPLALLILVPVGFIYYRIQKMFRKSSREIKRLESISRSPVFAHFSESLSGASSIRAFAAEDRFLRESAARFEVNQRAFYTMISLNRWLGMRLEVLGGILVFSAALFAVFSLHKVHPGVAGLSITYALLITGALNWAVRTVSEFESSMNAVERVNHYSNLPEERWLGQSAPLLWPSRGRIQIRDLFVTYRENTPCILTGISIDISPGEKVALVGRTGSGKSSLLLALCRILEAQSGLIMIDGIDISKLPLHELRNSIAIIPQDPVLFAGTVRSNLDPFLKCSNSQLTDALTRSHLMDAVAQMPLVLDAEVKEGGLNFSVGQRQLLCLARALLKQARILLLDEATASVDFELDAKIQETVRVQFKHSTVIVIAHRLNTIRDVNRVLVLESGKIVKVVQPTELLHEYLDANHDL